jgi:putative transposase
MTTRKLSAAARHKPMPKPAPQPAGFIDSAPATIGSLISELRRIISELEKHTADINYAVVSYETIRQWCAKFGPVYAAGLRRHQPRPGDTWHLDEVFLTINGRRQYLWRAVDQDGNVLDILVQPRRDAKAAKRFFRKLLKRQCASPRVLVTDKLRSYGVAQREVMPSVEHRQSRYLNNRAENSHQPTRHCERAMKRFRTPGGAQRFLAVFSVISPHFRPRRHRLTADDYRTEMTRRFAVWNEVTGLTAAA